jgi:uncharacterized protein
MRARAALLALLLLAVAAALRIPPYTGPVTDLGGVLSAPQRQRLAEKILDYRAASTNELGVLIVRDLEGASIEDYAHDVFAQWGIGKKGKDNGVLFVVALADRKVRLEVGYGLEADLTDLEAGRLVSGQSPMAAAFRAGDYAGGIDAVVDGVIQAIGGEYNPAPRSSSGGQASSQAPLVFFVVVLVLVVFMASRVPYRALRGGRGGGWVSSGSFGGGGGGGGFHFGGGFSGGGGASGRW